MPLFDRSTDRQAIVAAMHRSMAIIEFSPDGTILAANDNFQHATGS